MVSKLEDNQITEKKKFYYSYKIKSAVIAAVLYVFLSSNIAFKILNLILNTIINNHNNLDIVNDKNEPTLYARFIFAIFIAFCIFIF